MKTDTQLQQDVLAELNWEPSVNAAQIGVEVQDGLVTLAGHVNSFGEKWAAESATQRVSGVKGLAVELEVRLPGPSMRSDSDIAASAESVLDWISDLPRNAISVMVEGGWITLSGTVDWEYERQAAVAAIRSLRGVTGVSNQVGIRPKVSSSAIQLDIESALRRRAKADAKAITVVVQGDRVTLNGTVHSWSERALAKHSAWSAPGVASVVDNIEVVS